MTAFFKTALLLKPRAELSIWHFLARSFVYAAGMFILHRIFMSRLLRSNILFALGFGILTVGLEGFIFMATGGRRSHP
jgi:hypothetical protein